MNERPNSLRHLFLPLTLAVAVVIVSAFYFAEVPNNPAGFYIDESSIAYNAYCISQSGHDEYGELAPLYFRAFGDYKNPLFIYFLAGIFRLTGPSIAVARFVSAGFGFLAASLLGLLAWRISANLVVALVTTLSALLTPWLFEASRLVFEVAIYPAVTAIFLLCLWRAAKRPQWRMVDVLSLSTCLGLLTYSYSTGRLLGPLLALGLVMFIDRSRRRGILFTWLAYMIMLVPLFIFSVRHPGALTDRFKLITYVTTQASVPGAIGQFLFHYWGNLDLWYWLVTGEYNIRDHVGGYGSLLLVTFALFILGVVVAFRPKEHRAWWRYIVYGLLVSIVPAALTVNDFPQLRLITVPVFVIVLAIPALQWLSERTTRSIVARLAFYSAITLLLMQGLYFRSAFHRAGPPRWYIFDARFQRKIFDVALSTGKAPIYLVDSPGKSGYINALWYGTLKNMGPERFVRIEPGKAPADSVVISTEENCDNCTLITKSINYAVYIVKPSNYSFSVPPLTAEAFAAQVVCENCPPRLTAGKQITLNVLVKNTSSVTWPAVSGTNMRGQVALSVNWINASAQTSPPSGSTVPVPYDLEPGDTAGLPLVITAPATAGEYALQLNLVQQGFVSFTEQGWTAPIWRVTVEP